MDVKTRERVSERERKEERDSYCCERYCHETHHKGNNDDDGKEFRLQSHLIHEFLPRFLQDGRNFKKVSGFDMFSRDFLGNVRDLHLIILPRIVRNIVSRGK